MEEHIKLSVIIPTIGRVKELDELLESLLNSKFSNFEIIIVDQNQQDILSTVINKYNDRMLIRHHRVNFKGLSKAKNYGVSIARGEFISFPDDDCKIFLDTYDNAFDVLEKSRADMVFGKCVDEKEKDSVLNFQKQQYLLNPQNMLGGFVEATVVCKKTVFQEFVFDENMGAGTFFGAEEGYDWLYRVLTQSATIAVYSPEIKFYHPQVILSKGDEASLKRVFSYSCGTAYLCMKHKFYGRYYKRLGMTIVASFLYFFRDKGVSVYYKTEALGLMVGKIFARKL